MQPRPTKPPPWDIYVDERKVPNDHALGFLAVPNTASFMHKLFRCRHHPADKDGRTIENREVHWSDLHRGVIYVAHNWIYRVFQHRGAKFYLLPWKETETKEAAVVRFLTRFCASRRLLPPFDMVVFLDHDSAHAQARIQDNIRRVARIARCYHLDGCKNDCLQCCDLLLGATAMLRDDPTVRLEYPTLKERFEKKDKLKNSEVKRFLSGYLGSLMDTDARCVYDFRSTREAVSSVTPAPPIRS